MIVTGLFPRPIQNNTDWRLRAACRGLEDDVFFLPEGTRGPRKRARELDAKVVCARCPVIRLCLEWALTMDEPYGVWGGTTPAERSEMGACT